MRIKCICSYDGSNYLGYQRQPGSNTIQGTIEDVLKEITKEDVIIYSSGRTDQNVHARCQVFHFDTNLSIKESNIKKAMNSLLPNDIYIKECIVVDEDFHSRFSVCKKEYRYYINTGEYNPFYDRYCAHIYNLDIVKMNEAIKLFIGEHDFVGFSGAVNTKNTVRIIYEAEITKKDDFLIIRFVGNGFIKYSVRIMVGTLVEIGLGKKNYDSINEVFSTKNRNKAGKTIEAKGLFLHEVFY